jgi:hypothetical protein
MNYRREIEGGEDSIGHPSAHLVKPALSRLFLAVHQLGGADQRPLPIARGAVFLPVHILPSSRAAPRVGNSAPMISFCYIASNSRLSRHFRRTSVI